MPAIVVFNGDNDHPTLKHGKEQQIEHQTARIELNRGQKEKWQALAKGAIKHLPHTLYYHSLQIHSLTANSSKKILIALYHIQADTRTLSTSHTGVHTKSFPVLKIHSYALHTMTKCNTSTCTIIREIIFS